ncbi:hypothetical protein BG011_005211 [Mortierella polycephala]|uniref:Uncharacterized protein n=1 Tax=Mortierella polycephala TaxID=41804 RepID=A0A9P6PW48_9FUNG|nr:hypothetical protein BG011_005211 [Mortierella polycephala]
MAHPAARGGQSQQRSGQRQGQGQGQGQGQRTPAPRNDGWMLPEFSQGTQRAVHGQGHDGRRGMNARRSNSNSSQRHWGTLAMAPPQGTGSHGASANPSGNIYQTQGSSNMGSERSPTLTERFAMGYSIPTDKFNTEAFGTLEFRPTSNNTNNTTTVTAHSGVTNTGANTSIISNHIDEIDSLDDDLDLPDNFLDDDFGIPDKDDSLIQTVTIQSQTDPASDSAQNQAEKTAPHEAALAQEVLRLRLEELEAQLKQKEELLLIKSGEASMLRNKVEDLSSTNRTLDDRFRTTDRQHQDEKKALEEKYRKDLANITMNHQFEVQRFIADGPPGTRGPKLSELQAAKKAAPQPPPPTFPKEFSAFTMSQSTPQPKIEGFSVSDFVGPPRSPRKNWAVGMNNTQSEKPRVVSSAGVIDPALTTKPTFSLSSIIPMQTDEEVIRDKLLAGRDGSFGLNQLMFIKADEEGDVPLKGTEKYEQNATLEKTTKICVEALSDLMCGVDSETRSLALKATSDLLKISAIMCKPYHIMNALKVLRVLYSTYEDLARMVCQGPVAFLDNRKDPVSVTPTETSLSSTLACIYYLLVARYAAPPPAPPGSGMFKREHKLVKEAEEQLEADIFMLMDLVTRDLPESRLRDLNRPLIRYQAYDQMLRRQLENKEYRTLDRTLRILDILTTRDAECCKLMIGFSFSQQSWTNSLSQVETLVRLLDIQTEKLTDMANGVVPQLQIRVVEIFKRLVRVNYDQASKIARHPELIKTMVSSIRRLVDLAAKIHYQKLSGSLWQYVASETSTGPSSLAISMSRTEQLGARNGSASSLSQFSTPAPVSSSLNTFQKQPQHFQQPSISSGAPAQASSSSAVPSIISTTTPNISSSFMHPRVSSLFGIKSESLLYKPSKTDRTIDGNVGSTTRTELLGPHQKVFDYLCLLKLEMEFMLDSLIAINGYIRHLKEVESNEHYALSIALAEIMVKDYSLPHQTQELAQDTLGMLVPDENVEIELLNLVQGPKKDRSRDPFYIG